MIVHIFIATRTTIVMSSQNVNTSNHDKGGRERRTPRKLKLIDLKLILKHHGVRGYMNRKRKSILAKVKEILVTVSLSAVREEVLRIRNLNKTGETESGSEGTGDEERENSSPAVEKPEPVDGEGDNIRLLTSPPLVRQPTPPQPTHTHTHTHTHTQMKAGRLCVHASTRLLHVVCDPAMRTEIVRIQRGLSRSELDASKSRSHAPQMWKAVSKMFNSTRKRFVNIREEDEMCGKLNPNSSPPYTTDSLKSGFAKMKSDYSIVYQRFLRSGMNGGADQEGKSVFAEYAGEMVDGEN